MLSLLLLQTRREAEALLRAHVSLNEAVYLYLLGSESTVERMMLEMIPNAVQETFFFGMLPLHGVILVSYALPAYLADHCAERGKLYLEMTHGDPGEATEMGGVLPLGRCSKP